MKFKNRFLVLIRKVKSIQYKIKTKLYRCEESRKFKCFSNYIQVVVNVLTIVTIFIAILAFQNIGNVHELKTYIKSRPNSNAAVVEWEKELYSIRIGFNKDYVESVIGQPQMLNTISLDSATYIETTYSNSYFTLFCIYEEDSSLLGYLIIGNDEKFKLSNYRCEFNLFDYSINDAEDYCYKNGVESILFLRNYHGNRLDTNDYYFECNLQHHLGAVESYLIGYGVCDIGYINSYTEFYKAARDMHIVDGDYESRAEQYENSKNDSIRNLPINAFLIMKENDDSVKLLSEYLIPYPCLGMSRSTFANIQQDYSNCIAYFNNIDNMEW